jgi:hypothetical protein
LLRKAAISEGFNHRLDTFSRTNTTSMNIASSAASFSEQHAPVKSSESSEISATKTVFQAGNCFFLGCLQALVCASIPVMIGAACDSAMSAEVCAQFE